MLCVAPFVHSPPHLFFFLLLLPPPPDSQGLFVMGLDVCVFLSASFSFKCSSPPLPFNSSPFTNTERNANTHQKRPSQFEDFQALLFLLSSFLSFSQCDPYPGMFFFFPRQRDIQTDTYTPVCMANLHTHTHTRERARVHKERLTNCCPTLCSLGKHKKDG